MRSAACSKMQISLPPGEAHIWYVRTDQPLAADLRNAGLTALSPSEIFRYDKLRVERSRLEFLVKRMLLRATLSRYAQVGRQDWKFTRTSHGRPEIEAPGWARALSFNLSSTQGLVACAVARDGIVGLDVEPRDRRDSPTESGARWFAPEEVEDLNLRRSDDRRRRFIEYWTLKEAYVKARGLGLSLPLHQFRFSISGPERIDIGFEPGVGGDPQHWQFALLRPTAQHLLAVAIDRSMGNDLQIIAREASRASLWS